VAAILDHTRRTTIKKIISLALATVLVVSATVVSADAPTVQSVPVFEAMGGPPTDFAVGKKVGGASATVYRNDDGVGIVIETKKISAGTFTAWVFECSGGTLVPCDPFLPPSFCSGDTAGPNAKAELVCGLPDDDIAGMGAPDSRAPFVVFILDHGPIDPDLIHLQLSIAPGGVPAQTVKVD
jgi:hypothetical protein